MIYVTASDQVVRHEDGGARVATDSEACPDCLARVAHRRRPGERVVCFHMLHAVRRMPLHRAPSRWWRR